MEALRFKVHGKVQGVSFRAHTRRIALEHRLTGWAKNCPEGSVDILLCGSSEAIARAKADIIKGPALAQVARVEALSYEASEPPKDFEIA